jgi:hypothetical protein
MSKQKKTAKPAPTPPAPEPAERLDETPATCQACGQEWPPSYSHCPDCGGDVELAEPVEPPPPMVVDVTGQRPLRDGEGYLVARLQPRDPDRHHYLLGYGDCRLPGFSARHGVYFRCSPKIAEILRDVRQSRTISGGLPAGHRSAEDGPGRDTPARKAFEILTPSEYEERRRRDQISVGGPERPRAITSEMMRSGPKDENKPVTCRQAHELMG